MIERVHATDKETTQVILGMKYEIERLRAELKFWQATAQQAMENTDKALAVIELHKAIKTELEKATND